MMLALSWCFIPTISAEPVPSDAVINPVKRSDLNYFFDSISCEKGVWKFALSRNAEGMSWRKIDGKDDVTGVCDYKQTLVVPESASLKVGNKSIAINFAPTDVGDPKIAAYNVWIVVTMGTHSVLRGGNATVMSANKIHGTISIIRGED
ncbi:MAG: hypothetical protein WDO13_13090 [Verrucomicrobiota bacterium]